MAEERQREFLMDKRTPVSLCVCVGGGGEEGSELKTSGCISEAGHSHTRSDPPTCTSCRRGFG